MELAQKSLLGRLRRPDQVRRVLEKLRQEGSSRPRAGSREARRADDPRLFVGRTVLAVGPASRSSSRRPRGVERAARGSRVRAKAPVCAGAEGVPFDRAAFTVLGAIALQGVRLSRVELGSVVYVIGLASSGRSRSPSAGAGCRVVATDRCGRCDLALRMGAEAAPPARTPERHGRDLGARCRRGDHHGVGALHGPIEQAVEAVRKKGASCSWASWLELDRRPLYFKEAELVVSCSYGPGRYDPSYEERGQDYPAAYVRWTEQRNMQAVLDLMASAGWTCRR